MFDTNGNLIIPTLSENMDAYQKLYKNIFGLVDVSPASALGSDLAITAEMKKIADEFVQSAFMQNSPFEAIDRGLENLCFLRGIKRKINEHSLVLVTFSGADATVIPKGTIITNSATGETFSTNEQGLIVGGVFSVFANAVNAGRVVCDAGTVNVTTITGLTVTNASDGVIGYLSESDTDLRKRLLTYTNSLNIDEELYISLSNLQSVKYVNIISNPELTADANGIDAKSTSVVVLGGERSAIAKEIFKIIPADKRTFGDISEVVSSSVSGNEYIVKFSRPQEVSVIVGITITTDASFNVNDVGVIKESVLNFVSDKFGISDAVKIDSLYIPTQQDYNNAYFPFKGITKVSITLNGGAVNIPIAYNEFATLSSANLTITVN